MKLRTQVSLAMIATAAAIVAGVALLAYKILLPRFEELETQQTSQSVSRVQEYLDATVVGLDQKLSAWSSWDEAYEFAATRDKNILAKQLEADPIFDLDVDFAMMISTHGEVIWARHLDSKARIRKEPAREIAKALAASLRRDWQGKDPSALSAMEIWPDGHPPVLLVQRPVLSSERHGPARGTLAFGLEIGDRFAELARSRLRLPVHFDAVPSRAAAEKERADTSITPSGQTELLVQFRPASSLIPETRLVARMELNRSLYNSGVASLDTLIGFILLSTFLLLGVALYFMQRFLFARVKLLQTRVSQLGQNPSPEIDVRIPGTDELAGLSCALQKSIEHLRDTQVSLLNSSRLASLGEMAAGLSHEINNPLAIIHGRAQQLLSQLESGDRPRERMLTTVRKIIETCNRISRIITGLRTFARADVDGEFSRVKLSPLLDETLELCAQRFRVNGVRLDRPKVSNDLMIECRPVQLSQILLNLLNNAFDAIENQPEKWVRLDVRDDPDSEQIDIVVADSGRGVPPEIEPRLFEPFFTTKPLGKGTGLGLPISRGIAESHGGTLFVSRVEGHSAFILRIPRRHSPAPMPVAALVPGHPAAAPAN